MGARELTADVLVLGGGLAGCALAHHLAQRRAGRVLLYDRDHPCAGASSGGFGHLTLTGQEPWSAGLVLESAQEYRSISERWGLGAYRQCGALAVASSAAGERKLASWVELAGRSHVVLEASDGPGAEGRWPLASLPGTVRLRSPQDAVVSPSELTFAYAELASRGGVDLRWGWGEPRLQRTPSGWRAEAAGMELRASRVVFACGGGIPRVLTELGVRNDLESIRRQACRLRPPKLAGALPVLIDADAGLQLRSAPGGRVVVGGEASGAPAGGARGNPAAEFSFFEEVAGYVHRRLPEWSDAHLEAGWAGTCLRTPDRRPLAGGLSEGSELYVLGGWNGSGVMYAAALAARLAAGMAEDRWEGLAPASPRRRGSGICSPGSSEL